MEDKNTILTYLKEWYKSSEKTDDDLKNLVYGKITIHGYTFNIPTFAHRAIIYAYKDNNNLPIIDLGDPINFKEGQDILRRILSNVGGCRRRRSRSTKKSYKKSKKHTRRR